MLEVLNPLSLSYQWCHLNMKFHFPPILISQVESSYTLLYFTMNKEKKSIGQINTQNVRFTTPFANSFFFLFSLKEKRIVRKKTASVTIWGFVLQSLLTPPESGYRWWNVSYYFPKKQDRDRKDLFFFISYQHLRQRECQLLEGISDNAETHPNFPWASTQPLILLETYLSPLFS